jgi:hypothetical protein
MRRAGSTRSVLGDRHSGAMRSIEPGIWRFRVCAKRRIAE